MGGRCIPALSRIGSIALKGKRCVSRRPRSDEKTFWLIFWQGFLSDVLNPKVALFYIALLPQFMNPHEPSPVKHLVRIGHNGQRGRNYNEHHLRVSRRWDDKRTFAATKLSRRGLPKLWGLCLLD